MGLVLRSLQRRGHWEDPSLKGDPNQIGNLHYGRLGTKNFEQLPIYR